MKPNRLLLATALATAAFASLNPASADNLGGASDFSAGPVTIAGVFTPVDCLKLTWTESMIVEYCDESEKNASSAVTMFRRSDFIAVMYALSFVLANFGIASAAKFSRLRDEKVRK